MTDRELYLARASAARVDADRAALANVRDTCLRAEAAWLSMAARALKVDGMRERLLADKKLAAEKAALQE